MQAATPLPHRHHEYRTLETSKVSANGGGDGDQAPVFLSGRYFLWFSLNSRELKRLDGPRHCQVQRRPREKLGGGIRLGHAAYVAMSHCCHWQHLATGGGNRRRLRKTFPLTFLALNTFSAARWGSDFSSSTEAKEEARRQYSIGTCRGHRYGPLLPLAIPGQEAAESPQDQEAIFLTFPSTQNNSDGSVVR